MNTSQKMPTSPRVRLKSEQMSEGVNEYDKLFFTQQSGTKLDLAEEPNYD